jgi:hypothetical protein
VNLNADSELHRNLHDAVAPAQTAANGDATVQALHFDSSAHPAIGAHTVDFTAHPPTAVFVAGGEEKEEKSDEKGEEKGEDKSGKKEEEDATVGGKKRKEDHGEGEKEPHGTKRIGNNRM